MLRVVDINLVRIPFGPEASELKRIKDLAWRPSEYKMRLLEPPKKVVSNKVHWGLGMCFIYLRNQCALELHTVLE